MNDPAVSVLVGIIANHNYDGVDFNHEATSVPVALPGYGKATWETEICTGATFDGSISDGLYWAGRIHQFMTLAQANAWRYWWLIDLNANNEGLTDQSGNPAKRMYVLGQFSRFVRPNFYRIGAANNGASQVSAYKDSASPAFAIVAINSGSTTVTQTFNLTNFTAAGSITPWITSGTLSLASQAVVTAANSSFTYALPGVSVVTFVGQAATNTPPAIAPVADQVINAGATLVLTNTATDPNVPPQTLTFSLLSGPTNSTLDASSGVFSWRPLVSQAGTTNVIAVRVADDGSPSLSATNSFTVRVNPLSQPVLGSITAAGELLSFMANGALGPDYTVLTSTNLTDWQVLLTTNSPVMPITFVISNVNPGSKGFYRIQLGP